MQTIVSRSCYSSIKKEHVLIILTLGAKIEFHNLLDMLYFDKHLHFKSLTHTHTHTHNYSKKPPKQHASIENCSILFSYKNLIYTKFFLFQRSWSYWVFFHWSIVDAQHCVSFRCTAKRLSYTHIFFRFFSFISYYKRLNIVPCAIQ